MKKGKNITDVFLSYSWKDHATASIIDNDFKNIGITFKRDVRDNEYTASIKAFMKKIGESNYVVMIISREFLCSSNCMYEVLELMKNKKYHQRILPIILSNANIFTAQGKLFYIKFWEEEILKLKTEIKKIDNPANTLGIQYELRHYESVYYNIDSFLNVLSDLKCKTFVELQTEYYSSILKFIGKSKEETELFRYLSQIMKMTNKKERRISIKNLLKSNPTNSDILWVKGFIAHEENDFETAKLNYEKSFAITQKNIVAYQLAILFEDDHYRDYDKAKMFYEKAISLQPDDVISYNNLGNLLKRHFHEFEKAKKCYEMGIKFNEYDPRSYNNLAILLTVHFKDHIKAKQLFEKAIEINPYYAEAYNNLGELFLTSIKDYEKAKQLFEKAIELRPNYVHAYNGLSAVLVIGEKDYKKAKQILEKLLKLEPNHLDANYNLAIILFHEFKEHDKAKRLFEKSIELEPNSPNAYYSLSELHLEDFNQIEIARKYYEKCISIDPAYKNEDLEKKLGF